MLVLRTKTPIQANNNTSIGSVGCCESITQLNKYSLYLLNEHVLEETTLKFIELLNNLGISKSISYNKVVESKNTYKSSCYINFSELLDENGNNILDLLVKKGICIYNDAKNYFHFQKQYNENKTELNTRNILINNGINKVTTKKLKNIYNVSNVCFSISSYSYVKYSNKIDENYKNVSFTTDESINDIFNSYITVENNPVKSHKLNMYILQMIRILGLNDPQHTAVIEKAVDIYNKMPDLHPFTILSLAHFIIGESYPYDSAVYRYKNIFYDDPVNIYKNISKYGIYYGACNSYSAKRMISKRWIDIKKCIFNKDYEQALELFKKTQRNDNSFNSIFIGEHNYKGLIPGETYLVTEIKKGMFLLINEFDEEVIVEKNLFKRN